MSPDLITLEEFARRMQVGESSVWKWIRNGRLRPGRHFIRIDRVIRFSWGEELIQKLHEDCGEETREDVLFEQTEEDAEVKIKKHRYGKKINFDI